MPWVFVLLLWIGYGWQAGVIAAGAVVFALASKRAPKRDAQTAQSADYG